MDERGRSVSSFISIDTVPKPDLDCSSMITNNDDTMPTPATPSPVIYPSLLLSWSLNPSKAEGIYRDSDHVKTKGTIFLLPPSIATLVSTFNSPPRPKTRMSAGAVALCKHFERGIWNRYGNGDTARSTTGSESQPSALDESQLPSKPSAERQILHPFWPLPTGSNENKTRIAAEVLNKMLQDAIWKNVMLLHVGVAVYEIRNSKGYGMRWTLEIEEVNEDSEGTDDIICENTDLNEGKTLKDETQVENWSIKKVSFRGFLEPIEGLDHELPA